MKKIILITLLSFFSLTNCSLGNDTNENQQEVVRVLWHLANVSGGINGVDNDFDINVVVWEFNEISKVLTVTNNNETPSLEDGLDTGTYPYYITETGNGNEAFISLNNNEFGEIIVTNNTLVIDQNETSSGPAADGYIYTFSKQIIVEN
ncbi:hypothetical protein KO566_05125 [Flavobacteriaceae bacterium XHP0103]|uniref:hypothetical protein n=1 Tax=Marixanthotalea marina TaxID=2844359 RepID=UPI002989EE13|nr:hypothetical protein [Marixanthotalea marina]MBU3821433.1 hypothetical protein [Marixanthotalea marina]